MSAKSVYVRIAGGKRFDLVSELEIRVVQQFGEEHDFTLWGPKQMRQFLDSHKEKVPPTPPSRPPSERPKISGSFSFSPVLDALCTHATGTI